MIAPQFHPDEIRADCEPRGRFSFGLTARTIVLLLAGFVFLIFGLWDPRLSYAMLAWDALVVLAALLDGLRLPKPASLIAARRWSNAPSLDSQTEIELTVENRGALRCDQRGDLGERELPAYRLEGGEGREHVANARELHDQYSPQ